MASSLFLGTPSGDNPAYDMFMDSSEEALHEAKIIRIDEYTRQEIDKMARFDNDSTVAKVAQSVKEETVDVAQITIGKLIYTNGGEIVARFTPQLKWYEKLFTSAKKRELALLVGTYVAIKLVQSKYDHYLLQSVSAYINFQLQTELLGGVTQDTLDKLFSKFEAVES